MRPVSSVPVLALLALALSACEAAGEDVDRKSYCLETLVDNRPVAAVYELAAGEEPSKPASSCPTGFICASPSDPANTQCMTTVANKDSPWAKYPCWVNRDRPKTAFAMDCRCQSNYNISSPLRMCLRPYRLYTDDIDDLNAEKYGKGPHVYAFGEAAELRGGFFDAKSREIVVAGRFRNGDDPIRGNRNGFVMAISADSGDRRIVSGAYVDDSQVIVSKGDGPAFWDAWKVLPGPDGKLYALDYLNKGNVQVLRIDPATGDRTLVWTNEDPQKVDPQLGVCKHGSTDPSEQQRLTVPVNGGNPSFALDADGWMYFAIDQAGYETGVGLFRVSADGRTCEYFSRTGAGQQNEYYQKDVGSGPSFGQGTLSALTVRGSTLFAVNSINNNLYSVDLTNGQRKALAGGIQGIVYTVPNPHNPDEVWAVGRDTATILQSVLVNKSGVAPLYDYDTWNRGPLAAGNLGSGGVWFDPDNPDVVYFAHDNWAIVKGEVSTFNNYILSL